MSIIERSSPLNLAYKVVIVTNASSPIGVTVCNTLLKANAMVLGTDDKEKDDSLSASTYSHFQFYRCKLTDATAADDIVADAKKKFKKEHIDALVNLGDAHDDADMQAAYEKLAVACAETMKTALDGGAIVNSVLQAAKAETDASDVHQRLATMTKSMSGKVDSKKVRCNAIAPGEKENVQPNSQFEDARDHLQFLFKPLDNQLGKKDGSAASPEMRAVFDFSNVVLFLASGMSQGLDGQVLDGQGQHVQG